jgi:hypothetical protein
MPLYKWLVHYSGHPKNLVEQYQMAASEKLMQHIKQAIFAEKVCTYIDQCTVNICDAQGRTPLYYAIASIIDPDVCEAVVTQLIKHGAIAHTCIYNQDDTCKASTVMIAALLWRDKLIERLMSESKIHISRNERMRSLELHACKAPLTTITDGSGDYARLIRVQGDQKRTEQLINILATKASP